LTSFAAFMNIYLWAFSSGFHTRGFEDAVAQRYVDAARPIIRFSQTAGLESVLITNVILLAPVLLMLRRWRLPFGAVTFLFTFIAALMSALQAFQYPNPIIIALVAGLIADALIRLLQPRVAAFRAIATLMPLVLWTLYFLEAQLNGGVGWSVELATGVTVMAALTGVALSLLMAPPAIPSRLETGS
jgi:hypothetical protein